MEMETEINVVIIASIASLIVGVINIIFNSVISAKQNEIELKKTRIEVLEARRGKIESVKFQISSKSINLKDVPDIESQEAFSRMLDFFKENSSSLLSVGHLLERKFVTEVKELNHTINEITVRAKKNQQIGVNETQRVYDKMAYLENLMQSKLDESLDDIESEIERLLK